MEAVSIKDLIFEYPGSGERVLDRINLSINEGEIFCLCGETGCGKTTLLRNLKPVIAPHGKLTGEIMISGRSVHELDTREQAEKIGFVMQDPDNQIVTDRVWHELAFGLENLGYSPEMIRRRIAEIVGFFGIDGWYGKRTDQLSGGQKQILNLASIMVMSPEILILDEPTSRLDPVAAGEFLSAIRKVNSELGTTVLISEHRLDDLLTMATRLAVMKDGRLLIEDATAAAVDEIIDMGQGMSAIGSPERNSRANSSAMDGRYRVGEDVDRNYTNENSPYGCDSEKQRMLDMMPQVVRACQECQKEGFARDNTGHAPLDIVQGRRWLDNVLRCCSKAVAAESNMTERDIAESNMAERNIAESSSVNNKNAIELKKVWFRYSKNSEDVLKDLTMKIPEGCTFAITGGNGAGKSTLMSLICGSLRQYRGKVKVRGSISKLPQEPQLLFTEETVRDELRIKNCSDEMIEVFSLGKLAGKHPYDLSGGEQQRLALCEIFSQPADILLFDEPTKGLDAGFRRILENQIKMSTEKTILIVSHDMEFCAGCTDMCSMIFDGAITVTEATREFLSGNKFYTTQINRMAGYAFPHVMLPEELARVLRRISLDGNGREGKVRE